MPISARMSAAGQLSEFHLSLPKMPATSSVFSVAGACAAIALLLVMSSSLLQASSHRSTVLTRMSNGFDYTDEMPWSSGVSSDTSSDRFVEIYVYCLMAVLNFLHWNLICRPQKIQHTFDCWHVAVCTIALLRWVGIILLLE